MPDHRRAKPLPPDDRRRAIIQAVLPLLVERGATVTSREMADAAGVAEGTIFRAFPDKSSILIEAVRTTMDPVPVQAALERIPNEDPLEQQLEAAAAALMVRIEQSSALIGALRSAKPAGHKKPAAARRFIAESNAAILSSLTALFERHTDRLRVSPRRAATTFHGFIFTSTHPMLSADERPDAAEIVDVLLHGVLAPGGS